MVVAHTPKSTSRRPRLNCLKLQSSLGEIISKKREKEQRSKLLIALYTPVTQPYSVAKTQKPAVTRGLLHIQTPEYNP